MPRPFPGSPPRERIIEIGEAVGAVAGIKMKIAGEIVLMMQTEVGEVFRAGGGPARAVPPPCRTSAIRWAPPPARAAALQAQARAAALHSTMDQPHERATGRAGRRSGGWCRSCSSSQPQTVAPLVTVLEGLEVRADRMRENLELTKGLVFAEAVMMKLAPKTGRAVAHHILEAASKLAIAEDRHLKGCLEGRQGGHRPSRCARDRRRL